MRQGRDPAEHGMVAIDWGPHVALLAFGKDRAGKAIGKRRLADALRPDDEPGMVHASAFQRVVELVKRRLMAEQAIDLAGQ